MVDFCDANLYTESMSDTRTPPTPATMRVAFSTKQAAEAAGVSVKTLYREIRAGRLQARRLGTGDKNYLILADDLAAWAEALPVVQYSGDNAS